MMPPRHLTAETRRLWRELHGAWTFAAHEEAVLLVGLEAFDRMRQAQAILAASSPVVDSRDGPKQHPACLVESRSRADFMAAMRQLGFEVPIRKLDRHTAAASNAADLRRVI